MNLERTEDFPFKNQIYGVAWGNMQASGDVEFNYNRPDNGWTKERNVTKESMSVYYTYLISEAEFIIDTLETMVMNPDFNNQDRDSILNMLAKRRIGK